MCHQLKQSADKESQQQRPFLHFESTAPLFQRMLSLETALAWSTANHHVYTIRYDTI